MYKVHCTERTGDGKNIAAFTALFMGSSIKQIELN